MLVIRIYALHGLGAVRIGSLKARCIIRWTGFMDIIIKGLLDCGTLMQGQMPLLFVMLLAGLTGSFTHCLGMCSGFVLAQMRTTAGRGFFTRALIPYHAGRIVTYAALGGVAGAALSLVGHNPAFVLISRLMLAVAAMAFFFMLLERVLPKGALKLPFALPRVLTTRLVSVCGLARVATADGKASEGATWQRSLRSFGLGLSLGFLPCGLVYTALLAVAAQGNSLTGVMGMTAFGLGTVPALMGLGLGSAAFLRQLPKWQHPITLAFMGLNGVVLLGLAVAGR